MTTQAGNEFEDRPIKAARAQSLLIHQNNTPKGRHSDLKYACELEGATSLPAPVPELAAATSSIGQRGLAIKRKTAPPHVQQKGNASSSSAHSSAKVCQPSK